MSAAAARATLAAIGSDLVSLSGGAGERRGDALVRDAGSPPASFADLAGAPHWLRMRREDQRELARRVTLIAMARALAASIDGAWLRDLARSVGEETLDAAIAAAPDVPGDGIGAVGAASLETVGFALLRSALPTTLVGYLDWAGDDATPHDRALAEFCVAHTLAQSA